MIIDSHVHILPDRVRRDPAAIGRHDQWFGACHPPGTAVASADSLIEAMDRHGVDRAVVVGWPFADPSVCREQNDYVAGAVAHHPDRLLGFGIVNPGDPGASAEIDRCARLGLRGIGEVNADAQGFDTQAEEVDDAVGAAVMCDLPWMIHCSEPVGHEYPGKGSFTPGRLEQWLHDNPDLTVIAAHFGGGLPLYAHMPEVADLMRHIYVDTAAQPYLYRPSVYADMARLIGAQRILFGSDHPLLDLPRYRSAVEQAGLGQAEAELIFGEAARALLGL